MIEVDWPMGMERDLSTRPLVFRPQGFLVMMLPDETAAQRAHDALVASGFPSEELRLYPSTQILQDHEEYLRARSPARRVIGALTDDQTTTELYFGYARAGGAALWVYAADRAVASRAMRKVADHDVQHFRYFGQDEQDDIHVR